MEPYYDRDGIVIYHARCEDVLPSIDPADVDLLLTDPPYGMSLNADYASRKGGKRADLRKRHANVEGDDKPFDPSPLLRYRRSALFGANWYADRLPPTGSWLVWNRVSHSAAADAELAWTNLGGTVRMFTHAWDGFARSSENSFHVHPTQKPAALMRWIVDRWTKPGDLVLDPYMGSGPVAQACHELGRRYIGIELVEDYCKVAVSRLAQQTLDFGGAA
jgi:DNA modification methylase